MNPWEYLDTWSKTDLPDESKSIEWINQEMQDRYPGPYRVRRTGTMYWRSGYRLDFKNPQEETMFRLKWL